MQIPSKQTAKLYNKLLPWLVNWKWKENFFKKFNKFNNLSFGCEQIVILTSEAFLSTNPNKREICFFVRHETEILIKKIQNREEEMLLRTLLSKVWGEKRGTVL